MVGWKEEVGETSLRVVGPSPFFAVAEKTSCSGVHQEQKLPTPIIRISHAVLAMAFSCIISPGSIIYLGVRENTPPVVS